MSAMSRANEPAYPIPASDLSGSYEAAPGLTIREHFAGLAMQGLLASPSYDGQQFTTIAHDAVEAADALIAELAKPKENRLDEYGNEMKP